jgi:hypothetical protein
LHHALALKTTADVTTVDGGNIAAASRVKIGVQRCFLWDDISERLDHLGNRITVAERERIEAQPNRREGAASDGCSIQG